MTTEEIIQQINDSRGRVVCLSSAEEGRKLARACLRGETHLSATEIGVILPPDERVWMGHTVEEEILFPLLCRKKDCAEIQERLERTIARFDLTAVRSTPIEELDASFCFRTVLASACAHDPSVLVVCDSFSDQSKGLQTFLQALASNGTVVFLSPSATADTSSSKKTRPLPSFFSETKTFLSRLPVVWGIISLFLYAVGMIRLHAVEPVLVMGLLPLTVLFLAPQLIRRSARLLLPLLPFLAGLFLVQFFWGGYGSRFEAVAAWGVITLKLLFMTILSFGFLLSVSRARLVEGISALLAPLRHLGINVRQLSVVPVIALRTLPEIIALAEKTCGDGWRKERWFLFSHLGLVKALRSFHAEILGHGDRIGLTLASHGFGISKRPFVALKKDGSLIFGILTFMITLAVLLLALWTQTRTKGAAL